MASAWGNSWGGSWGNAWGLISTPTVARDPGAGSGKYRYHDDDIWEYIRALKKAHRKKQEPEVIEKPQKVVSYTTELYDPVVERLVLEIKVARASMRPKADIMELVKQLDDSILSIQEEEDEVIELFLLN